MSHPVQNLSKFSFRIKRFSAISGDRRLLLSVRMSPTVLKTRSLGTLLVGRPIKRQRQPLAGRVKLRILTDSYLHISVKHHVSTQRVATASLASNEYKARTYSAGGRQRASGEPDRRLQLAPQHTAGGRLHQSTGFIGRFSPLIPTVNCAVTSDLVQNGVL